MDEIRREKQNSVLKNSLTALLLVAAATASCFAMYLSDRMVFGNDVRLVLCFYSLAICLAVTAAVRRPLVTLAVSLIPAVCLWNYAPLFGGLFFPVALQAVMYDAADRSGKQNAAAFYLSVALSVVSLGLRIRAAVLEKRVPMHPYEWHPAAEKFVGAAFLFLLTVFYFKTLSDGFRKKTGGAKQRGKENGRVRDRLHTLHLFCTINAAASALHCVLFFNSDSVKAIALGQLLYLPFLLYRKGLPPITDRLRAFLFRGASD